MECIGGLVIFVVVGGFIASVVGCCFAWTLGPLDRAAKDRRYPIQFSLADLLCLFVLVQLPIGAVHCVPHGQGVRGVMVVVDVVLAAVAAVVWWTGVRTLSRAGIHVVWQRCLLLSVVLPSAVVGSFAGVGLPAAAIACFSSREPEWGGWLLAMEIPLFAILYGLGRFTRAVVASSRIEEPQQQLTPQ
jgi:hypothetical protein